MPWLQMLVAFLAGYGLMTLILGLYTWIGRLSARAIPVSAVVSAGNDGQRIEGILRALHRAWDGGRLAEVLVRVEGQDETRAIVARLSDTLPGIRPLPDGYGLEEALAAANGQAVWLLDLARIPPRIDPGSLVPGGCLAGRGQPRG
ncbi:MAG: hypothetical protein ACM3ZC_03365 [Bacteroidota bacterium]